MDEIRGAGVCHQCTELNGIYDPQQNQQTERLKLALVRAGDEASQAELYELRAGLVRAIDPLRAEGTELHDIIMRCTRVAIGELDTL